jgi:acetyl-CoA synthetase (ADP-forming)
VTKEKEVHDGRGFREALAEIRFPLVIKASSYKLSHKTESGLVHVDVRNQREAMSAFIKITKAAKEKVREDRVPILVQEMIKGSRELMAGLTRDAQFGPCVMFGFGGIFTEIFQDISFRVAPIDKKEALDMIGEIKVRKILDAFRGMPAADIDQLADILIKVGRIGLEEVNIKEIDINPIIISGSRPVVVDALIVLNP